MVLCQWERGGGGVGGGVILIVTNRRIIKVTLKGSLQIEDEYIDALTHFFISFLIPR